MGFMYGVAFFGGLLWWIKFAGFLAVGALVLALALYQAVFAVILHFAKRWGPTIWWVTAIGAWSFIEFARSHWPIGGLPWGLLGYGAAASDWTRSASQFIGVTGWSVVFIAIAAGLALYVSDRSRPSGWLLPPVAVLIVVVALGGLTMRDALGLRGPRRRRAGQQSVSWDALSEREHRDIPVASRIDSAAHPGNGRSRCVA